MRDLILSLAFAVPASCAFTWLAHWLVTGSAFTL